MDGEGQVDRIDGLPVPGVEVHDRVSRATGDHVGIAAVPCIVNGDGASPRVGCLADRLVLRGLHRAPQVLDVHHRVLVAQGELPKHPDPVLEGVHPVLFQDLPDGLGVNQVGPLTGSLKLVHRALAGPVGRLRGEGPE